MAIPFTCSQLGYQVADVPSNLYTINLTTGDLTLIGQLIPSGEYNAIGFNVFDNYINSYNRTNNQIARISSDATVELLSNVPNLPSVAYNVGDVDLNGYLYLYRINQHRFYVVDVNSSRVTYLQLVDPANGFTLQTSNFGVAMTPYRLVDWAFNPMDGQLYTIDNTSQVIRIDPISGADTPLTTLGIPNNNYGAMFYDIAGNLYAINNGTGGIYKITTTPTTATGILFSMAAQATSNDGTMCAFAQVGLMSVEKSVDLTQAVLGDILTYIIIITNISELLDSTNVVLIDPIPNGTTYVSGSAMVDGAPAIGEPNTGITIGSLTPGDSVMVEFQVKISSTELPDPNPVQNTATVTYNEGLPIESNTVTTWVAFSQRGIIFM